MAQISPELRAAIDVAKQRIKVDSYYPKAMNAGLKGNAQGFWSGTALGMFTGGLAGGLISLGLLAASVTSPFIGLPLILGVAGIGGTMGGATGARIGAGAGSIAGVTAERERRDRAEQLEKEILASPEKQKKAIEDYRKDPVVEKSDTVCETYATTRGKGKAFHKMVGGRTMLATVAICAVASMALFGAAFVLGGATVMSGLGALGMTSLGSALAIGAGAGAATGVSFGINYPAIYTSLTKHTAHLLSQNYMSGKKLPHIKNVREIEAEAKLNRDMSEGKIPQIHVKKIAADEMPSTEISNAVAAERLVQPEHQVTV